MSTTACALLRHDIRPRWIGDLLAAFCHTCGCLVIAELAPTVGSHTPLAAHRSGPLAVSATAPPRPPA